MASGSQPVSIIQPDSVFCATGGFHLRSSTVPIAQRMAAHTISSAPIGVERMCRMSSPRSTTMPSMPRTRPTTLRRLSGSCSIAMAMSVAQIGIVYAMIALRPAGSCWTPNSTNPFQPAMLKKARMAMRPHHSRGTRMSRPLTRATSSMPNAAKGSVSPRNVSGASSVTPSFSTGQLQPQTNVRMAIGTNACASGCLREDSTAAI